VRRLVLLLALALLSAGCSYDAERRLLILKEARIVLKHSATEPEFTQERAVVLLHIEDEVRDE
jgi:hypothetical protein